jgi:hypothetical protein
MAAALFSISAHAQSTEQAQAPPAQRAGPIPPPADEGTAHKTGEWVGSEWVVGADGKMLAVSALALADVADLIGPPPDEATTAAAPASRSEVEGDVTLVLTGLAGAGQAQQVSARLPSGLTLKVVVVKNGDHAYSQEMWTADDGTPLVTRIRSVNATGVRAPPRALHGTCAAPSGNTASPVSTPTG